jgi:hypothetical protein
MKHGDRSMTNMQLLLRELRAMRKVSLIIGLMAIHKDSIEAGRHVKFCTEIDH